MAMKRLLTGVLAVLLAACSAGAEEIFWDEATTVESPQFAEDFEEESVFLEEPIFEDDFFEEAGEDVPAASEETAIEEQRAEESDLFTAEDVTFVSEGEPTEAAVTASGTCGKDGENLTWTLNSEGILVIAGSGEMEDYDGEYSPWHEYSESIFALRIDENVTSIGRYAFCDLVNIENVTFPKSVTTLNYGAFINCNSLKSVVIPKTVKNMIGNPFCSCPALESIIIEEENTDYEIVDGVLINKRDHSVVCYPMYKTESHYTVPEDIKTIEEGAFESAFFENVWLPIGLERIKDSAFLNCHSLRSIVIPSTVVSMENDVFSSCTSLGYAKILGKITNLGDRAFYNCTRLCEVLIPSSVTSIGVDAFHYYAQNDDGEMERRTLSDARIYTPEGSFAEKYAEKNGITVWEDYDFPLGMGEIVKLELSLKDVVPLIDKYSFPELAEFGIPQRVICEAVYSDGSKESIDTYYDEYLDHEYELSDFKPNGDSNIVTLIYQGVSASINIPVFTFEEGIKTLPVIEIGKVLPLSYFIDEDGEDYDGNYLGFVGATFTPTESGTYAFSYPCEWTASFVEIYDSKHNLIAKDDDEDVSDISVRLEAGEMYVLLFSADDEDGSFEVTVRNIDNTKKIKLDKPKKPSVETTKNGVMITFDPVENADGYEIHRISPLDESVFRISEAKYLDYTVLPLQLYEYYIKAEGHVGPDGTIYSASKKSKSVKICWVPVCEGFKAKAMENGLINLSWKKNAGATGYQVSYRKAGNKLISEEMIVKKKKAAIHVSTGKWYAKVRAFAEIGGKTYYGPWTKEKKVKVK